MTGRVARVVPSLMMVLLLAACTTGAARDDATRTPAGSIAHVAMVERTEAPIAPVPSIPAPTPAPSLPTPDPAEPTPIIEVGDLAPPLLDLVSSDGAFDLAELAGHPVLLFFGYTHCPDVCPMTMGDLVLVLRERPEARVVFVTVDPERDTPEALARWTEYLPEGVVALTGSPAAIRAAADAYDVRYARVDSGSAGGYAMSHTAFVHLIDPDGHQRVTFPFGTGWATMVRAIDASAATASPAADLRVEDAWARTSPMVERAGAAYMVIRSHSTADDALIGASSPAAAIVEMHRTQAGAQGMMSMQQVAEIAVPAGGSVELAPGGYHLMLIDLVAPLVDGADLELVLTFRSGLTVTVHAPVGSGAPMASGMAGHPMASHAP